MEERMGSRTTRVLSYCRDIRSHLQVTAATDAEASLNGLLTAARSMGKVQFFDLRDVTGSVQIVANKKDFSEGEWISFASLKAGVRVSVRGKVGKTPKGQVSVFLSQVPLVHTNVLASPIAGAAPDYARVGRRMFVARLRNQVAEFLRSSGYVEIEPNFISTEWSSRGVEPMEVVYPGFGSSAFLVPTPATQLVDALVATGTRAVFAQSRCFSTTFRDEKSSAESAIVSAKAMEVPAQEHYDILLRCVAHCFGQLETFPKAGVVPLDSWRRAVIERGLSDPNAPNVDVPTLEVYRSPNITGTEGGIRILELCRLVWPPRRTIAEGAQEELGELRLASTTIHIERMATLLEDVPVRTIRNLGFSGGSTS